MLYLHHLVVPEDHAEAFALTAGRDIEVVGIERIPVGVIPVVPPAIEVDPVRPFVGGVAPDFTRAVLIGAGEQAIGLTQGELDHLSRHYEAARYFSLDEHTSVPDVLMIGQHSWDSLDARQRGWLQQAADASVKMQRALWQQATHDALAALTAAGVEIIEPDKRAFREAVKPMHASYQGSAVGELLERIEAQE